MDRTCHEKSAPDGGFGWCICAAACTAQFILAGIQNSFGILFIYIMEEFGGGKAKAGMQNFGNFSFQILYSMHVAILDHGTSALCLNSEKKTHCTIF